MSTETRTIDQLADILVANYAAKTAPLAAFTLDTYLTDNLTVEQEIETIRVAAHAVQYVEFASQFERRRIALDALRRATRRLTDERFSASDRHALAYEIGGLGHAVAYSYDESK